MKRVFVIRCELSVRIFSGTAMSCELLDKRFTNFAVIAELGRSMLHPYKSGGYAELPGTRSLKARGTILNSTGRRVRGSPSTWA